MAQLVGLHNPVGTFPAFLVPIFREHEGANALSVQEINGDDLIKNFDNTMVSFEKIIHTTQLVAVNRGNPALWSFGFTVDDFDVDTRSGLSRWLSRRLNELVGYPFLYLEAVEFVGDRARRKHALQAVFTIISENSEQQAESWRNFDVILPEVRAGIRDLVAESGREDDLGPALRRITLHIRGRRPVVVADNELIELVSQSRNANRRALARASSTVSAFGLLPPSLQSKQRSGTKMNRARSSGRRLSAEEAAKVKAMLQRGDRHHDIAAWFGVNQGRIAEVKSGYIFPEVSPAGIQDLPPQGSPGRMAMISMKALDDVRKALEEPTPTSGKDPREDALDIIESAYDELHKQEEG
jgi:hypothetical protein